MEIMQLEFKYVAREMAFLYKHIRFTVHDIVTAQQMTAPSKLNWTATYAPELKPASEFTEGPPITIYGIVLRIHDSVLYDQGCNVYEYVAKYLGVESLPDLYDDFQVIVAICTHMVARDVRVTSNKPHSKLFAIAEGQEIPRKPITNYMIH